MHNCGGDIATYSDNLTVEQIEAMIPIAKQYWINAGISEYELTQKLSHYDIKVNALDANVAAVTDTSRIAFSPNASGLGWFIDSTPLDSSEYTMTNSDLGISNGSVQSAEPVSYTHL